MGGKAGGQSGGKRFRIGQAVIVPIATKLPKMKEPDRGKRIYFLWRV
jgi:hypothetical protein